MIDRKRTLLLSRGARRPLAFVRFDTQFENAGDCLINRELVRLLADRCDLCLDFRRCPQAFADQVASGIEQRGALRAGRWPFLARLFLSRLAGRRCHLFLMPGGMVGSRNAGSRVSAAASDLSMPLAWAIGIRTCQVGASFGGLSDEQLASLRWRRRWMFRLCPRDTISADYLRDRGIAPDACIPDLAFNVFERPRAADETAESLLRTACFSLRTDEHSTQEASVTAAAKALCRRSGADLRWRPVVQVARDRRGMEALRARLAEAGFAVDPVVDLHDDVDACLAFYREVSLVVSNRLHVLLAAASRGARILAVVDEPAGAKLEGVLRDLGLSSAVVSSADLERGVAGLDRASPVDGTAMRERLHRAFDELLQAE